MKKKIEKFHIRKVRVLEKEVIVKQTNIWSINNITKVLKEIEKDKGFGGFREISFIVNEMPRVTYFINIPDGRKH